MVFYPGERSSYLNFDINSPRTPTIQDAYGLIGVGNNNDGILLDPLTIDNRVVEQLLGDYIEEQRTPGTFFVSKDGVTGNIGTSLRDSVPSVAEAVQLANAYVTANPSLSAFIIIHPGTYQEILPIRVKRNISIYGRSLRGIELRPAPGSEFNSFFKVDSGFKAWGLTIAGLQADTTRQAWCFEFDEQADNLAIGANGLGAYILKSPYIQNCTSYTAEDDRGEAGSISTGNTGGGLKVDGNACATNSPIRSMVVDSFTQINLGGPGCLVTNDGYAQLVSFFGTFCTYHCKAEKGGQVNFTGGTSDFGEYGLVADGYSPQSIFSAVAAKDHYGAIRTEKACTIDSTSNTFTSNTHGFVDGDQVKVSGTEVPDPLVTGIIYFVVNSTSNTFQLSTTLSGSVLDITGTTSLPVVVTKEGEYIIDCISFTSNRLGLESQPYNGTLAFPVLKFPRGTSLAASAANKGTVSSVDGNIATAILETSTEAVGIHEYVTGTGTVTVTRTGVDTTYPITSIDYSHLNGITNFTATGYTPLVNDTFFFTDAEFICPKSAYTVTGIQAIDNTGNVVSFNSSDKVGYRVNLYSQTNGGLLYPVTLGQKIDFRRRSQITAPAHVFEFVGSGTNYYALPDNGGIPDQTKAYQEINQGRVFISWTNEKGDFGVSNKFLVDGTTGEVTINTSSFNLSGLNQIGPFSRNGGISTVGTVLKEVSDDDNLISSLGTPDSNTVPTQSAVYNFVTRDKKSIFIGSNFVADSGTNYIVDTTNGPVTVTLSPNPIDGFSVSFTDYLGNFATNNLIINRSGTQTLIDGQTTRLILDNNFQSVELTWTQSDNNWSLSGAELLKISGAVSGVIGTGSVAGLTLSGSVTTTGAITLGGALGSINEHSDVDTTSTLPQAGSLLSYNGNSWVPGTVTSIAGNLTATTFTSNQTTGTAPFTVNSTTVVPNLNADLLDGYNIGTGGTSYIPYVNSSGYFAVGGTPYRSAVFALTLTTSDVTVTKTSDFADQFVIGNKSASNYGDSLPLIFNLGGGPSDNISAGIVAFREATGWRTGLSFWTNNITGGPTDQIQEKMRIDSGGNVGIGTTTPSEKLDVVGNVEATRFISTQATGIAPFTVNSTTVVPNLNADLLDGYNIGTGGTSYIPYVNSSGVFTAKKLSTTFNTSTDSGWHLTLDPVYSDMFIDIPKPDDGVSRIRVNGGGDLVGNSSLMLAARGGNAPASVSSVGNNSYNTNAFSPVISRVNSSITGFTFVFFNFNDTYKYQDSVSLVRTDTDGTQSYYWSVNATGDVESLGYTKATRFISTQATGTAPLTVSSTTVVDNLNADLLDGLEGTAFTKVSQPIVTVTYNDGGNSTLDHSDGNCVFTLTSNGTSTTIIHSNVPNNVRYGFELHLTWTAGAITFPASWSKGDALPSATGNYVITAVTIDGGTSFKIAVLTE